MKHLIGSMIVGLGFGFFGTGVRNYIEWRTFIGIIMVLIGIYTLIDARVEDLKDELHK